MKREQHSNPVLKRFLNEVAALGLWADDVDELVEAAKPYYYSYGRVMFRIPKTIQKRYSIKKNQIPVLQDGAVELLRIEEGVTFH